MTSVLIGRSGYVGSTILKQRQFDHLFRSTDISMMRGGEFNLVVCAGAPAQKWIANREPEADRANLEELMAHLATIKCRNFVLISTVDVFKHPIAVDEDSAVEEAGLHPYGLHRRMLERFVEARFASCLIVRLPGLVGPGLRKNVLFDLLNDNELGGVDSSSVYQFYPTASLWFDISIALQQNLRLVHLTAEPVSVAEVERDGFGRLIERIGKGSPARYDMRSRYASVFGGVGPYQCSRRESMLAIRTYAQSEARTIRSADQAAA